MVREIFPMPITMHRGATSLTVTEPLGMLQADRKRHVIFPIRPYEWLGLEGEGHGVFDETTRQLVFRYILSFPEQHLAGERVEPLQATES
ncbi:MAG: hypothetical protein JJT88_08795 [Gammaproteobacteria bacterium]|nr:hypothetical protein [Gammaproteobacteria bacterium]